MADENNNRRLPTATTPTANFLPTNIKELNSPEDVQDAESKAGVEEKAEALSEKGDGLSPREGARLAKAASQSSKRKTSLLLV
jgi:hypothetical protein